jgi:hypothetical protein
MIRIANLQQRDGIHLWLKDRVIYRDLYELGYDFGDVSDEGIELVPVLRINDGVLSAADVTEFILRFGV